MKVNFNKVDNFANATESLIYQHAFSSISIPAMIKLVKEKPKIYKEDVIKRYLQTLLEAPLVSFREEDEILVREYLKES